jgi:thioredoxin 1
VEENMSKAEKHESKTKGKSTFHEKIENKERAFVLFYATWCPFSQRFLQIFEEYSKNNPNECLSVIVDEEPDVCEEYAIEYYPTVILFKKGKIHNRLDAELGIGLSKKQLKDFTEKQ